MFSPVIQLPQKGTHTYLYKHIYTPVWVNKALDQLGPSIGYRGKMQCCQFVAHTHHSWWTRILQIDKYTIRTTTALLTLTLECLRINLTTTGVAPVLCHRLGFEAVSFTRLCLHPGVDSTGKDGPGLPAWRLGAG